MTKLPLKFPAQSSLQSVQTQGPFLKAKAVTTFTNYPAWTCRQNLSMWSADVRALSLLHAGVYLVSVRDNGAFPVYVHAGPPINSRLSPDYTALITLICDPVNTQGSQTANAHKSRSECIWESVFPHSTPILNISCPNLQQYFSAPIMAWPGSSNLTSYYNIPESWILSDLNIHHGPSNIQQL